MLLYVSSRYTECIAQVFYLQTGGVVMDYQGWRKRPLTPQFLSFMLAHPLEGAEEVPALQPLTPTPVLIPSTPNAPSTPQGAEIKIPGVGVTPVAVSTQLPAAVAQLTQQGMPFILFLLCIYSMNLKVSKFCGSCLLYL